MSGAGLTSQTYTVNVDRADAPPAPAATLTGLSVMVGGAEQITGFASGTTSYDIDVAHDVATVDVDATAASGATATVGTSTTVPPPVGTPSLSPQPA